MIGRLLIMFIAFLAFGVQSIVAAAEPNIKVLVLHDQKGALLEVQGKYKIFDPNTKQSIAPNTRYVGKVKYIQPIENGLKWGEEFPGIHQIEIVAASNDTRIYVNGNEYPGIVRIYDIGGSISVVNELNLENYLSYLLAGRYASDLPEEVLAALAIAERTNAFYFAQKPRTNFWSVDASQVGYKGFTNPAANSPIQRALNITKGMVLSRTGTYEGVVTPFPAQWDAASTKAVEASPSPVISQIGLKQAIKIADEGGHAANILEKAFPRTTIQLIK